MKSLCWAAVLAVVSVLFASCLESEENTPVFGSFFTVQKSASSASGYELIQDMSGDRYFPSLETIGIVRLDNVKRAFLVYSYQDDESLNQGENGIYYIDLVYSNSAFPIETKDLCTRQDTLRNDSISSFSSIWAYGDYVTTAANYYVYRRTFIDMVKEKVSNDTLYLRLNTNLYKSDGYLGIASSYNSFRLPEAADLEAEGIRPVGDSIVVAEAAKVAKNYQSETQYRYCKYKLE